jgi:hypothetical protein
MFCSVAEHLRGGVEDRQHCSSYSLQWLMCLQFVRNGEHVSNHKSRVGV